jgi:hypothetical protein
LKRIKRFKLKAHDKGSNRHNKGVAYLDKATRLATQHEGQRSNRRRKHIA